MSMTSATRAETVSSFMCTMSISMSLWVVGGSGGGGVLLIVLVVLGGVGASRTNGVILAMIGAGDDVCCEPIAASGVCHLIVPSCLVTKVHY